MTVVSKWTGIPLARMEEKETEKLLRMEEELKSKVIGQDIACSAISRAVFLPSQKVVWVWKFPLIRLISSSQLCNLWYHGDYRKRIERKEELL